MLTIRSVLDHCVRPIGEARLAALEQWEREADTGPGGTLEGLVEALVRPMVELSTDETAGRALVRLLLQVRALPRSETNVILAEQFDPTTRGSSTRCVTCCRASIEAT